MKRAVVKVWDANCVMGYVKGNTWYNKNGATRKFLNESLMINFLTSHDMKIID